MPRTHSLHASGDLPPWRPRQRRAPRLLLVGAIVAAACAPSSDRGALTTDRTVAVTVMALEAGASSADSMPEAWASAAFADSLAHRLAPAEGILVAGIEPGPIGNAMELRVATAMRGGRWFIRAELATSAGADAVWSSNYWRDPAEPAQSLAHVATEVAGEVYRLVGRAALKPQEARR